jgi:transcriptional regulator with XRE-family HTH domain
MSQLSLIKLGITKKLRDQGYRHRFFARMTQDEVAFQIRMLREKRGLRQTDLAKQAKMKQPFVSRIEQSEHASWNFQTLLRLASALDARLHISFEPMEDVIRQYEREEGEAFASTPETSATINVNVNTVGSVNTNQIDDVRSVAVGNIRLIPNIHSPGGGVLYKCALCDSLSGAFGGNADRMTYAAAVT